VREREEGAVCSRVPSEKLKGEKKRSLIQGKENKEFRESKNNGDGKGNNPRRLKQESQERVKKKKNILGEVRKTPVFLQSSSLRGIHRKNKNRHLKEIRGKYKNRRSGLSKRHFEGKGGVGVMYDQ